MTLILTSPWRFGYWIWKLNWAILGNWSSPIPSQMFGCSPETRIRKLSLIPFGIENHLKSFVVNSEPLPFEIGFGCWNWDLVSAAKVCSSGSSGCLSILLQRFVLSPFFPFLPSHWFLLWLSRWFRILTRWFWTLSCWFLLWHGITLLLLWLWRWFQTLSPWFRILSFCEVLLHSGHYTVLPESHFDLIVRVG